jgi:hypothetical protein
MNIDYKAERSNDIKQIKDSSSPKKIIVAGPGTGKSYLFSEIIKQELLKGKKKFLAITFIGKLGDALADDLCGLAETTTMHGFARNFVLGKCKGWTYYPRMYELIKEDLNNNGINDFEIGDKNYLERTKHYKAVGDKDVVYYATLICKKNPGFIPVFDLILVDEYQDFNEVESEFVDILAQKNDLVVVGDDDQALYAFKGSSPSFIRLKYDVKNTDWESHTLRFCSRCTEVIIKYFHSVVEKYQLNEPVENDLAKTRIKKQYICYMPLGENDSKIHDSKANSKIHLIKKCPPDMIAFKIRKELEKIVKDQKIKDVLVIGEGQSCESTLKKIAQQLRNYGFKKVDYRGDSKFIPIRQDIVEAYKILVKDNASLLGWRILGNPEEKEKHLKNAKILNTIIEGTPSSISAISNNSILALEEEIEDWSFLPCEENKEEQGQNVKIVNQNKDLRKKLLIQELKRSNIYLSRPIRNFNITVCNILNSKGLGADIVFLIGFDQGKLPSKEKPNDGEIYQMLVALTRAKKRIYLVNTVGKKPSGFIECLDVNDIDIQEIKQFR